MACATQRSIWQTLSCDRRTGSRSGVRMPPGPQQVCAEAAAPTGWRAPRDAWRGGGHRSSSRPLVAPKSHRRGRPAGSSSQCTTACPAVCSQRQCGLQRPH
eukprot:scaffold19472_cov37-Tisochrysis_lutea.AAC.3